MVLGTNYSKAQWIILIWAARISSFLSILGSATIIYMILRRRKVRLPLIHNRLIMSMSFNDILRSVALGVNVAAAPREFKTDAYPAYGNDATCQAQGFFMLFGFSVQAYNAMLCVYYLLVIKYNMKEDILKEKYEKYMHMFAMLVPLALAIWPTVTNIIQSYGELYCFIVPNRFEDELEDYNFKMAKLYLSFTGTFIVILFVSIVGSMAAVYHTVHKQQQSMNVYDVRRRLDNTLVTHHPRERNQRTSGDNVEGSKKETAKQAFMYAGSFLLTFLFASIARLRPNDTGFALQLLLAIFGPLQGFWNFFAFVRPKYVALRRKNKTKSCWWVWKAAVFSSLEEEERKKPRSLRTMLPARFSMALPVGMQLSPEQRRELTDGLDRGDVISSPRNRNRDVPIRDEVVDPYNDADAKMDKDVGVDMKVDVEASAPTTGTTGTTGTLRHNEVDGNLDTTTEHDVADNDNIAESGGSSGDSTYDKEAIEELAERL